MQRVQASSCAWETLVVVVVVVVVIFEFPFGRGWFFIFVCSLSLIIVYLTERYSSSVFEGNFINFQKFTDICQPLDMSVKWAYTKHNKDILQTNIIQGYIFLQDIREEYIR